MGYREILTKAVCGYGVKAFRLERILTIPEGSVPGEVLGCLFTQVSEPEASPPERSGQNVVSVPISGRFDVNVWYSYNNRQGTALAKETVRYTEFIPITEWSSTALGSLEAKARAVQVPECSDVSIVSQNRVRVTVEFSVQAEVIGETKIAIEVFDAPR
jgi:spore coat protein E